MTLRASVQRLRDQIGRMAPTARSLSTRSAYEWFHSRLDTLLIESAAPDLPGGLETEPIRARVAKATKGPWGQGPYYKSDIHGPTGRIAEAGIMRGDQGQIDAEFIAHARQDIPDLLAEVDRLRALAPTKET